MALVSNNKYSSLTTTFDVDKYIYALENGKLVENLISLKIKYHYP